MKTFLTAIAAIALASDAEAASTRGNFDRPPYVDGRLKTPVGAPSHATVAYRLVHGSLAPTPDRSAALAAALDSIRAELGRLGYEVAPATEGAPDVRFGARRGGVGPDGVPRSPDEIDTAEPRRMTFEVEGPSRKWRETRWAGDPDRPLLVVQLGFDDHWVRQQDGKGHKSIGLGSGRAQPIPWLTSLDDPVQVLQLTGALVLPSGKVARVASEGLGARRTGMFAASLGAQETLTEDDLRAIVEASDATWRVALRTLIASLTGS